MGMILSRALKLATASVVSILVFWLALSIAIVEVAIAPNPRAAGEPIPNAEAVEFSARDGMLLKGWFLSQPGSKSGVILLHGFKAARWQVADRARWLHKSGYNVLLYDARACGESAGDRISIGWRERADVAGAVDFMTAHGATNLVCLGLSQGACTAVMALEKFELPAVRGLILECPYGSLPEAVEARIRALCGMPLYPLGAAIVGYGQWRLGFSLDEASPERAMQKVPCPALIIAGETDVLATPAEARRLHAAARPGSQLWLIPWVGHGDYHSYVPVEYRDRVAAFLKETLGDHQVARASQTQAADR